MNNNFSEETKELFVWNYECWWCKKSHANCNHHILGRVSTSPLNLAPLNNFECHIGNGKLNTFEIQSMLLKKTLSYLKNNGYNLTKEDKKFMKKYERYYK